MSDAEHAAALAGLIARLNTAISTAVVDGLRVEITVLTAWRTEDRGCPQVFVDVARPVRAA